MMTTDLSAETLAKLARLRAFFDAHPRVVVAYSGGVDSALVYAVAHERLGEGAVAVTAVSASLARRELEDARELIARLGGRHVLLQSKEIQDPRYAENTPLRCYFCKSEVFSLLVKWAREHGFETVVDGTNLDDTGDQRPGRRAAREMGVLSPLLAAEIPKSEVRALARHLGLPNWDKAAMACLSSRIPFGTPVTTERLMQVEQAEDLVRSLGIAQFRVRHHGEVARIEVEPEDFTRLIAARETLVREMRRLGFNHISLDLDGYREGSLHGKGNAGHGQGAPSLHP